MYSSLHGISPELYKDLVHYFKYASSAYSPFCAFPNGHSLVSHFGSVTTGVEGFVARDDRAHKKELVVAFRGSMSLADVLVDSAVALVPFISASVYAPTDVRVHFGFLTAWNAISLEIIAILTEQLLLYPSYNLVTTGHSLGGALSILGAISLKRHFPDEFSEGVKCYSYGAPRVGNEAFAVMVREELGDFAFRAVHTSDGVPTMIPRSLGYHHHATEYWTFKDPSSNDTTLQCSAEGEDERCSLSVPSDGINEAHLEYFGIVAGTPFCL